MIKKTLLTSLVLFGAMMSQSASAVLLCDSYGKTWNLSVSGDSLVGTRDTTDSLGCGGTYTRGMFGSAGLDSQHFVVTSMEGNGNCVAVIWDGVRTGSTGAVTGTWYNNNGVGTGSFTMTNGACSALSASENAGSDPSTP